MSWLGAVWLGAIQGLTEFLPVSSDGHLSVAEMLLPGFSQVGVLFDVMVHLGTLTAIVLFFRRLLAEEARALRSPDPSRRRPSWQLLLLLLAATIPTGIVGIVLKPVVESTKRDPVFVGAMEIATGLLLAVSAIRRNGRREREETSWMDAVLIGTAQGLAVLPGLSRSAATISVALLLGLAPRWAAHFALLMAIPAILGAAGFEILSAWREQGAAFFSGPEFSRYLLGALVAGAVGYVTIGWLVRLSANRRIHWFAGYCIVFGVIVALAVEPPAPAESLGGVEAARVAARQANDDVDDDAARERQREAAVEGERLVPPGGGKRGEEHQEIKAVAGEDRRGVLDPAPRRHAEGGPEGAIVSRHRRTKAAARAAADGVYPRVPPVLGDPAGSASVPGEPRNSPSGFPVGPDSGACSHLSCLERSSRRIVRP
jgi:undecaprenyl-diphosphatase